MIEEEAKTKWCPFAHTRGFASDAAINRPFPGEEDDVVREDCRCIASACMAWRWNKIPNPEWKGQHVMVSSVRQNPYSETPAGIDSTTDGRCGLAGQS